MLSRRRISKRYLRMVQRLERSTDRTTVYHTVAWQFQFYLHCNMLDRSQFVLEKPNSEWHCIRLIHILYYDIKLNIM
jgi:hypothetical protein